MQEAFKFDEETLVKIVRGAMIAVSGALLTYLAQYVSSTDFGMYTPLVVAISSIFINSGKEFIRGK